MNDILYSISYDDGLLQFEPEIRKGDFEDGESTTQHIAALTILGKGDFRQFPFVGLGIFAWLNDEDDFQGLAAAAQKEYELDGMTVEEITPGNPINVRAYYPQ